MLTPRGSSWPLAASLAVHALRDRVRIEVLTSAPDIEFGTAWSRRQTMRYRSTEFIVVSRADLIASKKAAGRGVDFDDPRALEIQDTE